MGKMMAKLQRIERMKDGWSVRLSIDGKLYYLLVKPGKGLGIDLIDMDMNVEDQGEGVLSLVSKEDVVIVQTERGIYRFEKDYSDAINFDLLVD